MPLGSVTLFVVCAECSTSLEANVRGDRLAVERCDECSAKWEYAAHTDGYDMGYNAAQEDAKEANGCD